MKILLGIIIIILVIYVFVFCCTRLNRRCSGGVLFNTTGRSCGICSLVNLYEALIDPHFDHSTDVCKYNPTSLTTGRTLDVNEMITEFNNTYRQSYENDGYVVDTYPAPNRLKYVSTYFSYANNVFHDGCNDFESLITSPVCGMVLKSTTHYVSVVILNHNVVILLNDGTQEIYNLRDFLRTYGYDTDKPIFSQIVIVVNKKHEVLNSDDNRFEDLLEVLNEYANLHLSDEEMYQEMRLDTLIQTFFNTYYRRRNDRNQTELRDVILHTRFFHEYLTVNYGGNIFDFLIDNNYPITDDVAVDISNEWSRLVIFAYSVNFDNMIINPKTNKKSLFAY